LKQGIEDMPDPAMTTNADDEVAQFLRNSGVLRDMQRQALEINLRHVATEQGFELLHISHRHHPVVEFSAYMVIWTTTITQFACARRSVACCVPRR
jgi:hypothetical protein